MGSRVGFLVETFQTPLLDLTQTIDNLEFIPARPKHVPMYAFNYTLGSSCWIIESVTGTQTSPPTFSIGQDAARTNIVAATATTPSNADVNNAVVPSLGTALAVAVVSAQLLVNTPAYFKIATGAVGTGGYRCMAKFSLTIMWGCPEG
mgnify:CR=1 FL=1